MTMPPTHTRIEPNAASGTTRRADGRTLAVAAVAVGVLVAAAMVWAHVAASEGRGAVTSRGSGASRGMATGGADVGPVSVTAVSEADAAPEPGWPSTVAERPLAVADRLARIVARVNGALGTTYLVTLGHTDRIGEADGSGRVTVDYGMFWRLSEDAAAALVAHEFAHDHLGHAQRLAMLVGPDPGVQWRQAEQARRMELEADECAGRAIGATDYDPAGFAELLSHMRNTLRSDPLHRTYVPHADRVAAFNRGYQQGRAAQQAEGQLGGMTDDQDDSTADGDDAVGQEKE